MISTIELNNFYLYVTDDKILSATHFVHTITGQLADPP